MEDFLRGPLEALAPGAELWIVTDLERSSWTQRLDWYLGFQILRSKGHQPAKLSERLQEILQTWDLPEWQSKDQSQNPLLISSAMLLPNHGVMLVPFESSDSRAWAVRVFDLWTKMDQPSLRVFLPIGLSAASFVKSWPGPHAILHRGLVEESH